ncbi:hypothetical protein COU88_04550 [Candidatus Roizmanbacteria bacterium CG10_big_fil_rev_8_21_14_0_10_39_6]|uniref:Uncharacterized protein n=1 Tax=Candidatus Roizmanbacteria bacterium CG10_big_fil_rev_8_21_14_0_10_39_6 TaxID=1974853 RepID=A0A2M8KRH8_9BACT|nr:MAG: hypothetical protein COU88_04550 [Candidatus Roizmanbacteria bacterium CG10_big_fil_rev_8_21_14_0_10_39_6]
MLEKVNGVNPHEAGLRNISAMIECAIDNTDPETAASIRNELIQAARLGFITPCEAVDTAFPPYFGDLSKQIEI